jgi:hypothetical protein
MDNRPSIKYFFGTKHVRISNEQLCQTMMMNNNDD